MFQHSRPWEAKRLAATKKSVPPWQCKSPWLLIRKPPGIVRLVLGSPPSTYHQIYSNISSSNCRRCIKILSSIIAGTWPHHPTSTKPLNHLKPIFWPGQASLKSLGSTCSASEFGARSFRHPHWPPAGAPIESRASLRTCLAPVALCRPKDRLVMILVLDVLVFVTVDVKGFDMFVENPLWTSSATSFPARRPGLSPLSPGILYHWLLRLSLG